MHTIHVRTIQGLGSLTEVFKVQFIKDQLLNRSSVIPMKSSNFTYAGTIPYPHQAQEEFPGTNNLPVYADSKNALRCSKITEHVVYLMFSNGYIII